MSHASKRDPPPPQKRKYLLFEGLKALFFVLQLLLHAGQVSLQLVDLRHARETHSKA